MCKNIIFWFSILFTLILLIPFGKEVEKDLMNNILKKEGKQEARKRSEQEETKEE